MELIRGLHNLQPRHRGCVATIGAFDGVHRGHQAVLGRVLREARSLSLPAVVIVFEPLPREYLLPEEAPARLMDFREKFRALAALGVDRLLRIRFDETVRTMSAAAFVERIFVDGLGVQRLVLGDDFRFGRGREGDYDFLREQGERHGFDTLSTETLALDGGRVSSTRVREALADGDLELAAELLGRPYVITGRVVQGRQLGRTLGAPTANVELNRLKAPLSGVFTVRVNGGGLFEAPGVANVGTRPTVNDGSRANLEVHLLEGEPQLYGRRIDVQFLHRLRPELKFDALEDLKEAIHGDFAAAREWFAARTMDRYDA
jgi:riboflavin kinase/FMN adenylyltransferase